MMRRFYTAAMVMVSGFGIIGCQSSGPPRGYTQIDTQTVIKERSYVKTAPKHCDPVFPSSEPYGIGSGTPVLPDSSPRLPEGTKLPSPTPLPGPTYPGYLPPPPPAK